MIGKRTLLIGAHMSIAGGVHLAVERGAELGCATIQLFTKNASQWRERDPSPEEARLFRESVERLGMRPAFAHGGYLVNPASPDDALWRKSGGSLVREVERCRMLGLPYVVVHPGSHGGAGEESGLDRIARLLLDVIARTPTAAVRILLENTAGQGNSIGYRLEHLARLLEKIGRPDRLGICFDTAHALAAGYDLRTRAAYGKTMKLVEDLVGTGRVFVIHLNDSRKGLGSRVDRHEHIGEGAIGREGFRLLLRDDRFRDVPKVLETPKFREKVFMDPVNLARLRELAG